jgi:phosphatidylserine/phosphatidylglycerophosphate/cardiolipin synthase-like enzyme
MATKISDKVYNWCTSPYSVSSELSKDPKLAPGTAAERLYGKDHTKVSEHPDTYEYPPEELERAFQCGKFGDTKPSELFLRIYHDALLPLEQDPLMGVVSPSLMGRTGVIPLTIIGPLPDICRHMSNLIARAEKEVFLATNYWMNSDASRLITDSLRELSKRCQARGEKAVVKILYDRGNLKQIINNHQKVSVKEFTGEAVNLPHPDEVPGIDMEVVNFHRPALGTFHSKFMVVDRKHGVLSSNNIQDNDNVEMMVALEGPIVDSLYDVCLISWHGSLDPPLPSYNTRAAQCGLPTFEDPSFEKLFDDEGNLLIPERGDTRSLKEVAAAGNQGRLPLHAAGDPHYDDTVADEVSRMQSVISPHETGESRMSLINEHLNRAKHDNREATAPEMDQGNEMTPYIPHAVPKPFPMALVNRKPYGVPNHALVNTPQNEAWLSGVRNAQEWVFIQTPDLNAGPLLPEIIAAVKRGVEVTYWVCLGYNDAGELLPGQGGTNEMVADGLYKKLVGNEKKRLKIGYYVAKDQTQPVHNKFKSRSCHIKLMVVDGHIGIQGNGNQDTQSWYHSQEVNVMIDSSSICEAWMDGIKRNQSESSTRISL